MKARTIGFLVMALALVAAPATAAIYQWIDREGVTRFSSEPPPRGATIVKTYPQIPYDAEADQVRVQRDREFAETLANEPAGNTPPATASPQARVDKPDPEPKALESAAPTRTRETFHQRQIEKRQRELLEGSR